MVLYQLEDPIRVLTIYVAQGLVLVTFAYLAFRILKRDRKRLNLIFSGFYISATIGIIFNWIYGPIANLEVVLILNYFTNFGVFYSPIFFVVFDLILLKSEKVITTTKQVLILLGFGIYMFCMIFFVLAGVGWGVSFNADWAPVWELPFFLYLTLGETFFAIGPLLYLSFQIYNKFEDEQLKKKWKYFILGVCAMIGFMYGIFFSNFLDIKMVRTLMGAIGVILAIIGGYLMYNGVGRQLSS
ncbi:MAG: hypothetical protein JSV62_10675 [Promethearchaeota archaeon]|nr:MAG: hypothetical protein JSV62_10675 [Candidatus Lokiarchaeota archaeon]